MNDEPRTDKIQQTNTSFGKAQNTSYELIASTEKSQLLPHEAMDIINFAPIFIVGFDKKGNIIFLNREIEKKTGYTQEEILNTPITTILPALKPKINEFLSELLSEKLILVDFEYPLRKKSGGEIIGSWQSSTIKDKQGNIPHVMLFGIDINIRKQAESKLVDAFEKIQIHEKELESFSQRLEDANKHLDSFAYSVSHDLRGPLRAIGSFSQLLIEEYGNKVDNEMKHYLDRISKGAQKMGELIDDLLSFSRATRGEINYEEVEVETIIKNVIKEQQEAQPEKNIEFIINPLQKVEADKKMIEVIFTNLINNAVKYTSKRDKPHIEIGCEQKEDEIMFFVKDNGVGFDMKYQDKLFGAFQRLHSAEEYDGTGIGLATVKRLVSKHGGNIWAEAEVDRGATFYFTLPSKKFVEI